MKVPSPHAPSSSTAAATTLDKAQTDYRVAWLSHDATIRSHIERGRRNIAYTEANILKLAELERQWTEAVEASAAVVIRLGGVPQAGPFDDVVDDIG
jgi:hypothetical protein